MSFRDDGMKNRTPEFELAFPAEEFLIRLPSAMPFELDVIG